MITAKVTPATRPLCGLVICLGGDLTLIDEIKRTGRQAQIQQVEVQQIRCRQLELELENLRVQIQLSKYCGVRANRSRKWGWYPPIGPLARELGASRVSTLSRMFVIYERREFTFVGSGSNGGKCFMRVYTN